MFDWFRNLGKGSQIKDSPFWRVEVDFSHGLNEKPTSQRTLGPYCKQHAEIMHFSYLKDDDMSVTIITPKTVPAPEATECVSCSGVDLPKEQLEKITIVQ